jgi:hypothetical protein
VDGLSLFLSQIAFATPSICTTLKLIVPRKIISPLIKSSWGRYYFTYTIKPRPRGSYMAIT